MNYLTPVYTSFLQDLCQCLRRGGRLLHNTWPTIPFLVLNILEGLPRRDYRIRPNNRTMRLGFSKLLWKLVLNYVSTYYK